MAEAVINGSAGGPSIPASADTLLRLQIGKASDAPERSDVPVYLLAAPTDKLILAYRAGCLARGIRNPDDEEMAAAMALTLERTNAIEGLDAKTYAWHRSLIERSLTMDEATPKYDRAFLENGMRELETTLAESDPSIQKLRAQRDTFANGSMEVACAVALRGCEHSDVKVEVLGVEATAETLAQIPANERQAIGLYWFVNRNLTDAQKKTSDSPPPSPTIPTTTPDSGAELPSSTASKKGSRRSRGTRSGTRASTSTPVG